MISVFLGLTVANLLFLSIVFALGLGAVDGIATLTDRYHYHVVLGIAAGLMATLTHVAVYTYFMATCKWLHAATDKAALDPDRYLEPALANKARVFGIVIAAVAVTMLSLFTGAGADPTIRPWWPVQIHLVAAALAVVVNLICAVVEYHRIRRQGQFMDRALAILNRPSGVNVEHA